MEKSTIYIYINHNLKYINPITLKTSLEMKFCDLISTLYEKHPIFYDYNFSINYNKSDIPLDSEKKMKEYDIKYYSKLKLKIISSKQKEIDNKLTNKMFERQKDLRNTENNGGNINEQINAILEDMCIYGNVMKKKILEETSKNPDNFIKIDDALAMEKTDPGIFSLGLISKILNLNGINLVIKKKESNEEKNIGESDTFLQFLSNGMIYKKKYDLIFDFGNKINLDILRNNEQYEVFKDKLKKKISKIYNISEDEIVITCPKRGSVEVQLIFQSDEFNNLNLEEFIRKFKNDPHFQELKYLKEIRSDSLIRDGELAIELLDPRGNRSENWAKNEFRGGKPYYSPEGWIGIGLKVEEKYGNNLWLGMNNEEGEWCVAYHGVGRDKSFEKVKEISRLIVEDSFHPGDNQVYEGHDDMYHPGKKVGKGVYFTPFVNVAEGYSGICNLNGGYYKTVLMVRVKPDAIRCSNKKQDYWVVSGTTDEVRPYRILYKKL